MAEKIDRVSTYVRYAARAVKHARSEIIGAQEISGIGHGTFGELKAFADRMEQLESDLEAYYQNQMAIEHGNTPDTDVVE